MIDCNVIRETKILKVNMIQQQKRHVSLHVICVNQQSHAILLTLRIHSLNYCNVQTPFSFPKRQNLRIIFQVFKNLKIIV